MPNKVNWGLALSAWGKITVDANGNDVYGTPIMFLGDRQVNFSPAGDLVKVFADGTVIYVGKENSGYTGSLELTNMDDEFAKWALSEEVDSKNVQYEIKEPVVNRIYLLWEWVQDTKNTRHIMYNVTVSRPDQNATTAGDGDSKTAQYQTVNLTAIPRADGIVKAKTRVDVDSTTYNNWFNAAYVPSGSSAYTVTVAVADSSNPAEGALVVLSNGAIANTDAEGKAYFNLANGDYDVMVSASGYTAQASTVTVNSAAVTKSITLVAA